MIFATTSKRLHRIGALILAGTTLVSACGDSGDGDGDADDGDGDADDGSGSSNGTASGSSSTGTSGTVVACTTGDLCRATTGDDQGLQAAKDGCVNQGGTVSDVCLLSPKVGCCTVTGDSFEQVTCYHGPANAMQIDGYEASCEVANGTWKPE